MTDNKIEKERLVGVVERQRVGEEFPTAESPRKSENVEVLSWMEKLERRFGRNVKQTPGDAQDDTTQIQQGKAQPPVTVPVTATQMQIGQKANIEEGLAWLVLWVKRQIQKLIKQNRKVLFLQEEIKK